MEVMDYIPYYGSCRIYIINTKPLTLNPKSLQSHARRGHGHRHGHLLARVGLLGFRFPLKGTIRVPVKGSLGVL